MILLGSCFGKWSSETKIQSISFGGRLGKMNEKTNVYCKSVLIYIIIVNYVIKEIINKIIYFWKILVFLIEIQI